jgi:stearoyl-CoA desaturase (delta-9 desaturase)
MVHDDPDEEHLHGLSAAIRRSPSPLFAAITPPGPLIDRIGDLWVTRISFRLTIRCLLRCLSRPIGGCSCCSRSISFMGPIHGATVNWCGHKYGYSNYDNDDHSKNSLPMDFLMMGELYSRTTIINAPTTPTSPRNGLSSIPTWQVIRALNAMHIIRLRKQPERRSLRIERKRLEKTSVEEVEA